MAKMKKVVPFANEVLNLPCEWEECDIVKDDIESFISHLLRDHLPQLNGDDLHCHWKDCEGFTENLAELRRHILLHAFHAKIKCHGRNLQLRKNIPNCTLGIQSRNIIPELPDPLVCYWESCLEEYECPERFYRHVDYHSENVNTCLWQDCNRTFTGHFKLREHLRSHTQEKLVACPTCGGMFASRTKFSDHIQRQLLTDENDEENLYICEYCSKKMNSERLLRDHMRHHVNHYKCPYCDMTCPTPSGVQVHVQYRHAEEKPYSCQYCDYKCKSENDLRKHLESHSQVIPYKCPVEGCSYATRSQTCYNVHYRKTHEEKGPAKYACHLCEKKFTRGNYLTKHLVNVHKYCWPSGHCRFRYHLHTDGYFKLQTVRYESLELSQTMMGNDNDEGIDDPENLVDTSPHSNQEHSNVCGEKIEPCISSQIIQGTESSVPSGSVIFCLENGNVVRFQQGIPALKTSLNDSYLQDSTTSEQEPVLIQIVDSADETGANSNNASVFVMTGTDNAGNNYNPRAIQVLTKNSEGKMVLETAELITEYDPSLIV
ncbi:histone H4 transcription factor-like [Uloborus diversus]|uniref:histone H4 transcription factor-like n=1 Tax=Uloborus diversus TaxID=327109 RepID=UPI002409FFD4|nr:histone H4 transcription factor-like [Uloborus diversus]XP_054720087.1 histone H4 transcription factor-like [Uloborus diversus]XP_054720093.1 histone H4 transcription factor-like [Uloborus diversus]XP_054720100.1 histone H4 transcription factor-like [Uloborus diversus]